MVTVLFKCPKCRMDNISRLASEDETCAFASGIPIRRRCGGCRDESFVVQTARTIPPEGYRGRFFGLCRKIATECRRRAMEAGNESSQRFFLEMERYWLGVSAQCDPQREAVIVSARDPRPSTRIGPRQIA
jgi:hypothetical protein